MKNERFFDNSALIEGCLKRDPSSWESFVGMYSGLVQISAKMRLKRAGIQFHSADIDDIKQNIFARIWREDKLRALNNPASLPHWLAIVSGNEAINHFRNRSKEPAGTPAARIDINDEGLCEFFNLAKGDVKDEITHTEILGKIDDMLASMPANERLVIKLNLLHGKLHREISEILHMPVGTVSSHIKRAKERLRTGLKEFL